MKYMNCFYLYENAVSKGVLTMKKVLFICHGNVCRSVSAEYIMKDLAKKNGVDLYVSSAATSREEIGNDIYPPAKRKLKEKGVPFSRHYARQATMSDYLSYDYLICMDENNVRNLNRMFDNDPDHKIYKLLSRDVSDPWYSNDFETAYNDIYEGCKACDVGEIIMKQNLHTHSIFCDGKDTIEEMTLEAISKGFDILGFSGHGYLSIDDGSMRDTKGYISEVERIKSKYASSIQIHLGIEEDMLGRISEKAPFEYVIGSKHFLGETAVDYSKPVFDSLFESYSGDYKKMCKDYYSDLSNLYDWQEVDIIGHLDLITKYNEDESYFKFNDKDYMNIVCDCIDRLLINDKIFEVNTGAIARGYRKTPYPSRDILEYLYAKNARICLNSDCHDKNYLDCAFESSLDLIQSCGFKELQILTNDGFVPVKIK